MDEVHGRNLLSGYFIIWLVLVDESESSPVHGDNLRVEGHTDRQLLHPQFLVVVCGMLRLLLLQLIVLICF